MKIKLHYVLMSLALIFLGACGDDDDPIVINRTVLVYIMGDNTLNHYVSDDISEMTEGAAGIDLTRNNLLVYADNGSSVKFFRMYKDKKGEIVQDLVQTYNPDRNSVGLSEMKEVLSLVYKEYPAESYGLVLWSHGEGWKPGTTSSSSRWIGQDDSATLSISTLSEALSVIPYYEYILFDACFMQSVEVAYELREHTGYFIGSPAEIPGPGAPYQDVVSAMFAKSDAAMAIARGYYEYYRKLYTGKVPVSDRWTGGVAISVIKADKLEALAAATKSILPVLIQNGESVNVTDVLDYDRRTNGNYIGYYDFDLLMKSLANATTVDLTSWSAAYEAAVPYAESTDKIFTGLFPGNNIGSMFSVTDYSGVSIYVPRTGSPAALNDSYKTFQWYQDAGWSVSTN
ncbi:MAG: hypothetical protein LBF17_02985 [Mediterranea sp.]|jgi:hypothetical protein|nr:hypothetical protein [Mediterranea sp.]